LHLKKKKQNQNPTQNSHKDLLFVTTAIFEPSAGKPLSEIDIFILTQKSVVETI